MYFFTFRTLCTREIHIALASEARSKVFFSMMWFHLASLERGSHANSRSVFVISVCSELSCYSEGTGFAVWCKLPTNVSSQRNTFNCKNLSLIACFSNESNLFMSWGVIAIFDHSIINAPRLFNSQKCHPTVKGRILQPGALSPVPGN